MSDATEYFSMTGNISVDISVARVDVSVRRVGWAGFKWAQSSLDGCDGSQVSMPQLFPVERDAVRWDVSLCHGGVTEVTLLRPVEFGADLVDQWVSRHRPA
jgi:hypothetical protein